MSIILNYLYIRWWNFLHNFKKYKLFKFFFSTTSPVAYQSVIAVEMWKIVFSSKFLKNFTLSIVLRKWRKTIPNDVLYFNEIDEKSYEYTFYKLFCHS